MNRRRMVNLGIVGGGEGVRKALSGIRTLSDISIKKVCCDESELVGLIDPAIRCDTVSGVFESSEVDAIYAATPNHTHMDMIRQAVSAKKQILIEKPLLPRASPELKSISTKYDAYVSVAFKKRFNPGLRHALKAFEGTPLTHLKYYWSAGKPKTPWYLDSDKSGGGVLVDLGSHVIDLFCHVGGKISNCSVNLDYSKEFVGIDVSASVNFGLQQGCRASATMVWSNSYFSQILVAKYEKGGFIIQRNKSGIDQLQLKNGDGCRYSYCSYQEYRNMFIMFSNQIHEGARKLPSFTDGMDNIDMISHLYSISG